MSVLYYGQIVTDVRKLKPAAAAAAAAYLMSFCKG